MKLLLTLIKYLLLFLSAVSPVYQQFAYADTAYEADYINMGIPLINKYTDGAVARTAWDVEIFDNFLFVASGDYDKNAGPVSIFHYDFSENQWIDGGTVPDEQVSQFNIIDGALTVPGCDPREEWDYGNIYQYENGQWVSHRNIPGGIHQFDIVEFEDKIFVGLGVMPGDYPIAVSYDHGETYQRVSMIKDGIPVDTTIPESESGNSVQIRVYDFFILNNSLYAFYSRYLNGKMTMEVYQYHDDAFHYHSSLPSQLSYTRYSFDIFRAHCQYNDSLYFSTGNLYYTDDLTSAKEIILEDNTFTTDLRIINNKLFVLTSEKTEAGKYRNSVWCKSQFYQDRFSKVFYFTFDSPAQSFTYDNGYFYFGMGEGILSDYNASNGSVLSVKYTVK